MVLFLSTPSAKWNGKDSKPISISTDGDGKRHVLRLDFIHVKFLVVTVGEFSI